MAGKMNLRVDQGADFRLTLRWGTGTSEADIEDYDLVGATAWLGVGDGAWYRTFELDIEEGEIVVALSDDQTRTLRLPAPYVIAVEFPGGETRHVLEGRILGEHRRTG